MSLRLTADYGTPEQFIEAVDLEVSNGGLLVRGVKVEEKHPTCIIAVKVAGELIAEIEGRVEAIGRTGVAVSFDDVPFELVAFADRVRPRPADEEVTQPEPPPTKAPAKAEAPKGPISERVAALTVPQKMQLALSGDREARIVLLRDTNKTLHAFVLRNPRIELDEVLFAAKNTQLSPDALTLISEHVMWSKNMQVCIALVRNVKTPMPVALRLLPKLPGNEIRAIAKGGARDQLVGAARKLLAG